MRIEVEGAPEAIRGGAGPGIILLEFDQAVEAAAVVPTVRLLREDRGSPGPFGINCGGGR